MTKEDLEDKCIAFMKKMGLWDDDAKLKEFVRDYVVMTDTDTGEIICKKRSEFQPDLAGIDLVLCAYYDPDMPLRPGCEVHPCYDCQAKIVVSPDSPTDPPKVCPDCAMIRKNKHEEDNA